MDRLDPGSITVLQAFRLQQLLGQDTPTDHLSFAEAEGWIKLHDPSAAWRQKPPTPSQKTFLLHRGLWRQGLTRGEASALIGEVKDRVRRT
jgi:hypothetical protein